MTRHCYISAFAILMLLVGAIAARANDFTSDFDAANKLYEQGRYAEAVAAYDKLIASGGASAAVYFNRGNAEFKLNQLGHAIASYRQARTLAPRDADLRSNLRAARTRARGGAPYATGRWQVWLEQLTLNEWTMLTLGAGWLLFLTLAWMQWRPKAREKLRKYTMVAGALTLVFGMCLAVRLNTDYFTRWAVVVTGETDLRHGPLEESPAVCKVRDGIEVSVLDQKDDWFQVEDPAQRVGWIRKDELLVPGLAKPARN